MGLQINFQSIRSIVTSIIVVLGLLSLAATLVTGQVYHRLTLQSQLENIEKQLAQETGNILQRLKQFSLQLSTVIINSDAFSENSSSASILTHLKGLQQSPFLQNGVLNVKYIFVYDGNGRMLHGLNYHSQSVTTITEPVCSKKTLVYEKSRYSMSEEVKYDICVSQGTPYLTSWLPYAYKKQLGYLLLVTNITGNLAQIDKAIAFPIRIHMADESVVFSSKNWPDEASLNSIARYDVANNSGITVFHIDASHQDINLDEALSMAQLMVISGTAIIITLAIMLSLYILRKTVISPVSDVVSSLRMVRDNKDNIGAQVHSRGADEIIQLMDDFNAMSKTLEQLYQALEKMAYTDPLTRLGNRKLFHEKLEQIFIHSNTNHRQFALLMIDLDKFKQVNDTYGHQVGDSLLIEISNRFSDVMRHISQLEKTTETNIATGIQDHLARLGGDEFAVILPDIKKASDAIEVAKQIVTILDEDIVIDGINIDVGLSIGIAVYPQHARDLEQLILCADQAMYQAKQGDRDFMLFESA